MYPFLINLGKKGIRDHPPGIQPRASPRSPAATCANSCGLSLPPPADTSTTDGGGRAGQDPWPPLQTPAAAQLSFFFARITVPLSIFVSHLCCLKILRTRQKNTFAFDSWRLTERRWRRRRRRHCRWSPACSWTA